MNLRGSVQSVQSGVGVQVPQDDDTVLASGSVQRSIRRDSDTGNVTGVANEISVELVVVQVPRLNLLVKSLNFKMEFRDLGDKEVSFGVK